MKNYIGCVKFLTIFMKNQKNDEFIKVVQERVKTVQNEEWKKSIEYEIKWTLGE